jgi:hypothetical protein
MCGRIHFLAVEFEIKLLVVTYIFVLFGLLYRILHIFNLEVVQYEKLNHTYKVKAIEYFTLFK